MTVSQRITALPRLVSRAVAMGILGGSVLVFASSCSSSSSKAGGGEGGADNDASGAPSGDEGPVSGSSPNGALRIVSVDVVGDHVTDGDNGQKVRLVALVADKKGADHIAGGDLRGASGKLAVPFDAKGNGRYEAELGWDDIARAQAISFVGPEGSIKLVAKFVDGDSNEASAEVPIPIQCTEPSYSACSGMCTAPIESDRSNCGQCGKQCKTAGCTKGQCLAFDNNYSNVPKSCKDVCAVRGTVCASTCEYSDNGVSKQVLGVASFMGETQQILTDCDATPTGAGTLAFEMCCCADP